jgi:hypothetical protein
MTVGIDDGKFFLIDNWPGEVTIGPNPSTWTTPSTTEDFPLGTKRAVYDDTNNGWSTLMYLKYIKGTAAAVAVKGICGIDSSEMATAGQYCHVCNDGGESQLTGPIAIALATMLTGQYGWFWVGGVCPVDTISGLDGIFGSDGSITAGVFMVLADSASYCKFHLGAATDVATFSAFSMAADTES